jgi:hypothetical protein
MNISENLKRKILQQLDFMFEPFIADFRLIIISKGDN